MFSIISTLKHKLFPKSLLSRFILIIIIPTLIGQSIAVYLFYQRHWYNVSQRTSGLITTEILSLIQSKDYTKNTEREKSYLSLDYIFLKNQKLPSAKKQYIKEFEIFKKVLRDKISQEAVLILEEKNKVYLFLKQKNGVLKIILPYRSLINSTTGIFVLWIFSLTIILLSVSLIFSKNQIKSIIELTNAAEKYGNGDKKYSYKPSGAQEIRKAGLAFLKMKSKIEQQSAKRTQMLAMISHDLKTPLTRMKLQVELLENEDEKEELKYDIDSMQQMILSYLDFARGEGGEDFQEADLNKWLREYVKSNWSNDNIKIIDCKNKMLAQIKPHSFKRAISNIISNALKYSTEIIITFDSNKDNAIIYIEDNGSGIKKEDRKLVFKPFYRVDKSRSLDNSTNVGLGLAISREIINGHSGTITLDDSKILKGLLVKIQIPLKEK